MQKHLGYSLLVLMILALTPGFAQAQETGDDQEWALLTFPATGTSNESLEDAKENALDNAQGTIEMLNRLFVHVFVVNREWTTVVQSGGHYWAQCEVTVSVSGSSTLIKVFDDLWGSPPDLL